MFVKSVSNELNDLDIKSFDMVVFFNPSEGDIKFVSYGKSIVKAMEEAGLRIDVKAPTPEAPSVAKAIENYLAENK